MRDIELSNNERIDDLEFRGLKLIQNAEGFKFGVDAVLLSDFAKRLKKGSVVVDIGSGTGIISVLLCEKTNLKKIYGIEVQEEVAKICEKNIKLNHLENKFEVFNMNVKNIETKFSKGEIDVVVTNPPYKKEKSGLTSIDKVNLISRHEVECTLEDIIDKSSYLLKDLGQFYMVHRAERLVDIMCLLRKYRLEPKVLRFVHSKPGEKPNLVLVKAVKYAREYLKIEDPLYIYGDDGEYTDEIYTIYEKKREK